MIFQDPRAHINPVRTIGDFMTEALRTNRQVETDDRRTREAVQLLAEVGIEDGAAPAGAVPARTVGRAAAAGDDRLGPADRAPPDPG